MWHPLVNAPWRPPVHGVGRRDAAALRQPSQLTLIKIISGASTEGLLRIGRGEIFVNYENVRYQIENVSRP